MKKIIYGTAVAAAVMLSSCQKHVTQIDTDEQKDKVVLTASIGEETKTFLEQTSDFTFKVRWAEEDDIILWDRDIDYSAVEDSDEYAGYFHISSGVGESVAEFTLEEGYMPDRYLAAYGDIWPIYDKWLIWAPYNQGREMYETKDGDIVEGFDYWDYPMYAVGEGSNVQFKNLFAVLKLGVVGNGETLNRIRIQSLDEGVMLSGDALFTFDDHGANIQFCEENVGDYEVDVYDYIEFNPTYWDEYEENGDYYSQEHKAVLSDEPVECYIVLPAQEYPSGLKITLVTDEGYMEVTTTENLTFTTSELREIPRLVYEPTVSYEDKWLLKSYYSEGMPAIMSEEDGYYVLKNYYAYGNSLYLENPEREAYGWSPEYNGYIYQLTNTCGKINRNGYPLDLIPGYYDFYLDADKQELFIMDAGFEISELPTLENVVCHDYWRLRDMRHDKRMVKVSGTVTALSERGFFMRLGLWGDPIFVYTYDSGDAMKQKLADVRAGNLVELYATNSTYFDGLPELKDIVWCNVKEYTEYQDSGFGNMIKDYYKSDYYDYVSMLGILSESAGKYYIDMEGVSDSVGYMFFPSIDLEQYVGQKVLVSGYYIGTETYSTPEYSEFHYINIVPTHVSIPDTGGSTEDVVPDDDIVVPAM